MRFFRTNKTDAAARAGVTQGVLQAGSSSGRPRAGLKRVLFSALTEGVLAVGLTVGLGLGGLAGSASGQNTTEQDTERHPSFRLNWEDFNPTRLTLGPVTLEGFAIQGGWLIGSGPPGTLVGWDNIPIRVGENGFFMLGLHHREPPEKTLMVRTSDGTWQGYPIQIQERTYVVQRIDSLDRQLVTPNPENAARIQAENREIRLARQKTRPDGLDYAEVWVWPVQGGRLSGAYGVGRILNGVEKTPHYGIDIATPAGTPVRAPVGGQVVLAAEDFFLSGGTVILEHGGGVFTSYLHLSKLHVQAGDRIERGAILGLVGATGRATGPHLDFRVNWFHKRLDPLLFLRPAPSAS